MPSEALGILEEVLKIAKSVDIAKLSAKFKLAEIGMDRVESPIVIRLDGISFSRIAKAFGFPRSSTVHEALVKAGEELARFFNSELTYVVSDEINVFVISRELPYGGRVSKIVGVSASIASAVATSILGSVSTFDSRIVKLSSLEEAIQYFLYRVRVGSCNYLNTLFTKVLKLEASKKVEDIVRELSREVERLTPYLIPKWKVFGTCISFEFVEKEAIDRVKGSRVKVRRRVLRRYNDITKCLHALTNRREP